VGLRELGMRGGSRVARTARTGWRALAGGQVAAARGWLARSGGAGQPDRRGRTNRVYERRPPPLPPRPPCGAYPLQLLRRERGRGLDDAAIGRHDVPHRLGGSGWGEERGTGHGAGGGGPTLGERKPPRQIAGCLSPTYRVPIPCLPPSTQTPTHPRGHDLAKVPQLGGPPQDAVQRQQALRWRTQGESAAQGARSWARRWRF
jgi:hypothetical protein